MNYKTKRLRRQPDTFQEFRVLKLVEKVDMVDFRINIKVMKDEDSTINSRENEIYQQMVNQHEKSRRL